MTPAFTVSEFVAVFNQTLEYAYPSVEIVGELSNFKVSKNRWIYFDLKDENSSVRFFGTVYTLPGPLEDGMMLKVTGVPRLHPTFGFSITAGQIQPVGEGSIKKAAELLKRKLAAEGLFDLERKRPLPYPPTKIGLVTSRESAAYADFIKIINSRWGGVEIVHADVGVQGEAAMSQIVRAIDQLNTTDGLEIIVITRGGGSADDLAVFNSEPVVRAVAGSRAPTLVAIGHEIDFSLAELAADQRASTPSNAAELLVPEKASQLAGLDADLRNIKLIFDQTITDLSHEAKLQLQQTRHQIQSLINDKLSLLEQDRQTLHGYDPRRILKRGYALIRNESNKAVSSVDQLKVGSKVNLRLIDGEVKGDITWLKKHRT